MPALETIQSSVVRMPFDDVDTDQIIPARFLKATEKTGLSAGLFAEWRAQAKAEGRVLPLDEPGAKGATILLAGNNFGCGSSREHAPWALVAHGFRAIVARSFGDIFRQNSVKNGLLPVVLSFEDHSRLLQLLEASPTAPITIDLPQQTVRFPDGSLASFPLDPFAKHCLRTGVDELGYLLSFEKEIARYEEQRR